MRLIVGIFKGMNSENIFMILLFLTALEDIFGSLHQK